VSTAEIDMWHYIKIIKNKNLEKIIKNNKIIKLKKKKKKRGWLLAGLGG
jgi:hypothetical protein